MINKTFVSLPLLKIFQKEETTSDYHKIQQTKLICEVATNNSLNFGSYIWSWTVLLYIKVQKYLAPQNKKNKVIRILIKHSCFVWNVYWYDLNIQKKTNQLS